jgi:hypothetical protein
MNKVKKYSILALMTMAMTMPVVTSHAWEDRTKYAAFVAIGSIATALFCYCYAKWGKKPSVPSQNPMPTNAKRNNSSSSAAQASATSSDVTAENPAQTAPSQPAAVEPQEPSIVVQYEAPSGNGPAEPSVTNSGSMAVQATETLNAVEHPAQETMPSSVTPNATMQATSPQPLRQQPVVMQASENVQQQFVATQSSQQPAANVSPSGQQQSPVFDKKKFLQDLQEKFKQKGKVPQKTQQSQMRTGSSLSPAVDPRRAEAAARGEITSHVAPAQFNQVAHAAVTTINAAVTPSKVKEQERIKKQQEEQRKKQ